jgi:hypothetical protein
MNQINFSGISESKVKRVQEEANRHNKSLASIGDAMITIFFKLPLLERTRIVEQYPNKIMGRKVKPMPKKPEVMA